MRLLHVCVCVCVCVCVYLSVSSEGLADSYNKNQRHALISQIYFGIELYMFWTGLLSISRSLVMCTQQ